MKNDEKVKDGPKAVKPHLSDIRDLSPEQRREFASKGGKASGEARRLKGTFRSIAKEVLTLSAPRKVKSRIAKIFPDITKDTEIDNKAAIIYSQLAKALAGDTRAFEVIRDTAGEKPVDIHKLEEPVVVKKVYVTPEEKAAADRHIEEALRDGN